MSAGTFARLTRVAPFSPQPPGTGREDFGGVLDHAGLLIGGEQEDSVALMLECEGGEDFAGDAKIGVAEMGAFGGLGKREGDVAKSWLVSLS